MVRLGRRRGRCAAAGHRLRPRRAPDPGRRLLQVPRPARGPAEGGTAPGPARGAVRAHARCPRRGPRSGVPGPDRGGREPGRERAGAPRALAGCPGAHAPAERGSPALRGRACARPALDRRGRTVGRALGLRAGPRSGRARGGRWGVVPERDRPVHPGGDRASRRAGAWARARGRSAHADPAPEPRPDGPASHCRGGRGLPRRCGARRLRAPGRSPPCLAAVRRALRRGVAGRGPLRRLQRLPARPRPHGLALARLGDRRLQLQHALRPVRHRAARRRPVARGGHRSGDAPADPRHGLQPQPPDQRRGWA